MLDPIQSRPTGGMNAESSRAAENIVCFATVSSTDKEEPTA